MKLIIIIFIASLPIKSMDVDTSIHRLNNTILSQDFLAIHQVSQALLRICPEDQCVIIGIGQSPTPIIAYLYGATRNYAWALPLSNFSHGIHHPPLEPYEKMRLFKHFSQFLPNKTQLGKRSIMLLDYASNSGGISLLAASRYIENYVAEVYQDNTPKIEIAAIKDDSYIHRIPFHFNYIFIFNKENNLINNIKHNIYEEFSPFGMFHVQDTNNEALDKMRPNFLELVQWLNILKNKLYQFKYQLRESKNILEPTPSFKLIKQSGTFNVTFAQLVDMRDIAWYVYQLRYYRGEDLDTRLNELLAHPLGKQELTKEWAIFIQQPKNQQKIIYEIIQNQEAMLANIAENVDLIADDIAQDIIKTILLKNHVPINDLLEKNVPLLRTEDFLIIFDELFSDTRCQKTADRMLDNFLMPSREFFDNDFLAQHLLELATLLRDRFNELIAVPESIFLAKQKFQEYVKVKTWLPQIILRDPKTKITKQLPDEIHHRLRIYIFNELSKLFTAQLDKD